jgi:hypothetical protein
MTLKCTTNIFSEVSQTWQNFPGSPSNSNFLNFDINQSLYDDIKKPNVLTNELKVRIYRKTEDGILVDNRDSYFSSKLFDGGFLGPSIYRMIRNYQQNVVYASWFINPPLVQFNPSDGIFTAPSCNGKSDGTFSINHSDIQGFGNGKYQVSIQNCSNAAVCMSDLSIWEFGFGTKQFDSGILSPFTNLSSGLKVLQIVDINDIQLTSQYGCPANFLINIPETPPLDFTLSAKKYTNSEISCVGMRDGEVTLDVQGGTPPYRVTKDSSRVVSPWVLMATPDTLHTFTNLRADSTYHFAVTDINNCPSALPNYVSKSYTLESPDTLRFFRTQCKELCRRRLPSRS